MKERDLLLEFGKWLNGSDLDRLVIYQAVVERFLDHWENLPSQSDGKIIIPVVQTDKNNILARAMTWISEDANTESRAKEIFDGLASLMDKQEIKAQQ